ncbi:hypothetical protein ACF053_27880 [Streptomyces kanasensis]|uniref:hypothetical protein n=1 Tax=Streptomyces kanasensis TaxID=936756 RepID=UPI0036FC1B96
MERGLPGVDRDDVREGPPPPGPRVTVTPAECDEGHLRRLRLVRAVLPVGWGPRGAGYGDDESPGRTIRLGAAAWALERDPQPPADDPAVERAREEAE